MNFKDVIIGAYFTGKIDPQRKIQTGRDSFDYVADWLHSICRLNLHAIVMHDNLSESFVRDTESLQERLYGRVNCKFHQVALGKFTASDERFLLARDYLNESTCENVFIVDVADAWFGSNPFFLLRNRSWIQYFALDSFCRADTLGRCKRMIRDQWKAWKNRKKFRLFVGSERSLIRENAWMKRHYRMIYGQEFNFLEDRQLLNCGIVGGTREEVIHLLNLMQEDMELCGVTDTLNDMVVFNKVVYESYSEEEIYREGRLHSPWRYYVKKGGYCIYHK